MELWRQVGQNGVNSTLWFHEAGDASTPTTEAEEARGESIYRSTTDTVKARMSPI